MTEFEWGFCVGIIVGEGCFQSRQGVAKSLEVKMHADDWRTLALLQHCLGGVIYGPYEHQGRRFHVWRCSGAELADLIPALDNWLPPSRKRDQFDAWKDSHWSVRFPDLNHTNEAAARYVSRETSEG